MNAYGASNVGSEWNLFLQHGHPIWEMACVCPAPLPILLPADDLGKAEDGSNVWPDAM